MPETARDRWSRVPKNYYKKPDRLQRVKFRLSMLALFLTLAWCAWGMNWTGKADDTITTGLDLRANHGELAGVHAAWDRKCDACHIPFEPIDGRPWLSSQSAASSRTSDKLCIACHEGAPHHKAILNAEVRSCAECHRDHRGREASLVKLDDVECTRCHASLKEHTNSKDKPSGSRDYANQITSFTGTSHPDFTPAGAKRDKAGHLQDQSGLKFNHKRHMTPGIVRDPGQKQTPYLVKDIPIASERIPRYGSSENEPVQLKCSSCHALDAADRKVVANASAGSSSNPVGLDGKYYQPVRFEAHCQACHDLNFDPRYPEVRVPHGVQPEEVVKFLKGTYAAKWLEENPRLTEKFVPASVLPGKAQVDPNALKDCEKSVVTAEEALFGFAEAPLSSHGQEKQNCHECHKSIKGGDGVVPREIVATNVPEVWLTHARFDHTAHRGVSCFSCHEKAYALRPDNGAPVAGASMSNTDYLNPDIKNCQQCHAPAQEVSGKFPWSSPPAGAGKTGGVSYNCTECHAYHGGDHATKAGEDTSQPTLHERTIEQFLRGKDTVAAKKSAKP